MINLKSLKKYLEYKHFKIQTLQNILALIKPNCYVATIGLKDDNYSVKIDGDDTLLLRFLCYIKNFEVCCIAQWFFTRSKKVYKTNKASISNASNARIYSCNIHR